MSWSDWDDNNPRQFLTKYLAVTHGEGGSLKYAIKGVVGATPTIDENNFFDQESDARDWIQTHSHHSRSVWWVEKRSVEKRSEIKKQEDKMKQIDSTSSNDTKTKPYYIVALEGSDGTTSYARTNENCRMTQLRSLACRFQSHSDAKLWMQNHAGLHPCWHTILVEDRLTDICEQFDDKREINSTANSIQHGGSHYKTLKIQPWDYIHSNNIPYMEGCAIKYLTRWRDKGGIEDLKKAKHFIEKLIEMEEEK